MGRNEGHGEANRPLQNVALEGAPLIEPSVKGDWVDNVERVRDRCDIAQ